MVNGALLGASLACVVAFLIYRSELGSAPLAVGLILFTVFLWRWSA